MFVPKPVLHLAYKDISVVEFHRMDDSMMNRNFDFDVVSKQGEKHTFSGIDKSESQPIINHFKNQKVKVNIVKEELNPNEDDYDDEEDDEEDEQDSQKESQNHYEEDFVE